MSQVEGISEVRAEMAYEFNGIELLDMALEMQPLTQPAKLFGYVLSIARLGSVQDQDASLVASHCDGDWSQLRQSPPDSSTDFVACYRCVWLETRIIFKGFCFSSVLCPAESQDGSLVSRLYTCMGISRGLVAAMNACQCFCGAKQSKFRASDAGLPPCLVGSARSDNRRQ